MSIDITLFVTNGLIYCSLSTIALLIIGLKSPRLMLQDYPQLIQDATTPKTKLEKKLTVVYGIPFLLVLIGYPLWFGFSIATTSSGYWTLVGYIYILAMIGNVFDLIILDWLVICFITPRFVVIPGTEGSKGYKDYFFHFIGFLKGVLITFILSLIVAGIVKLFI